MNHRMLGENDIVHSDAIVQRFEADEFDRAADQILAARKAPRRAADQPVQPPGSYETVDPSDTNAVAFAKGFEMAADAAGRCCGCNCYGDLPVNPYDGTTL